MAQYETALYKSIRRSLDEVRIIDCHEHLQRDSEMSQPDQANIGRFFLHYANCDLISAGMPAGDMAKVLDKSNGLDAQSRWALLKPWYRLAWNTAYCEAVRIAIRDLYGVDDLSDETADLLTERMASALRMGYTREVFDKAGIDYALTNPFGPAPVYNPDFPADCFIVDMVDEFTQFPFQRLEAATGLSVSCLDDYLQVIDWYFDRYAHMASAFKVGRAYDRTLYWADVPKADVEKTFLRMRAFNDWPDRRDVQALEDFILHYLVRKCSEYRIRMKFHTGLQEGNGNIITNSRAALMANLFMKYPSTQFDIYHISYPYQEELVTLCKNFPNVTIDFCWMWIINPTAGRRALSDMLDAVPANKIHGFGGDFIFVEGAYAHAQMARREIARVLAEKVEEGRFDEDYAVRIGQMLLRDNPIANFGLDVRRKAFQEARRKE